MSEGPYQNLPYVKFPLTAIPQWIDGFIKGPYQRNAHFRAVLYILLVVVEWDGAMTRVVILPQTSHHPFATLSVTYQIPLSISLSPLSTVCHTFLSISLSITVSISLSHSLSKTLSNVVIYNIVAQIY